jgi:hypothetical protein
MTRRTKLDLDVGAAGPEEINMGRQKCASVRRPCGPRAVALWLWAVSSE